MAPSAPTVLVVHGALGSARQMRPVADALRAQDRYAAVHTVELPGHGDSPLPPAMAFSMDTFARALGDAVRRVSGHRPIVFGYSMGGYAALLLEQREPGTLGGIVTLGTMLHWTPASAARAASRLDADALRARVPAFAAALEERHAGAGGWELMLARTAAMLHELGAAPPLTDQGLRRVHCPVHLLVGDRDDSVTLEEAAQAAAHLPHARASLLPDTPHPIEKVALPLITREVGDLSTALTAGD